MLQINHNQTAIDNFPLANELYLGCKKIITSKITSE